MWYEWVGYDDEWCGWPSTNSIRVVLRNNEDGVLLLPAQACNRSKKNPETICIK